MSLAILAQGTLFKIESDSSVGSFATVPETKKLTCPTSKFDILDVSSHDSANFFREYIPGMIDGENCTADINFVPTNAIHTQIRTDAYARTKKNWEIIFPGAGSGAQIAFAAYIVNFVPKADAGAILEESITLRVTGVQTWT